MNKPRCALCKRKLWGNYGDGRWRHISDAGMPLMSILCGGLPITAEETPKL